MRDCKVPAESMTSTFQFIVDENLPVTAMPSATPSLFGVTVERDKRASKSFGKPSFVSSCAAK